MITVVLVADQQTKLPGTTSLSAGGAGQFR
jgi:hypothetical protein